MKKIISLSVCILLLWFSFPASVSASGDDVLPCSVLSVADPTAAAENVKNSVVMVMNDNGTLGGYGSGVILSIDDNRLVIVTAGHVVGAFVAKYAQKYGMNFIAYFADPDTDFSYYNAKPELGFNAPADLLYYCRDHDIAFLTVSTDQLDPVVKQSLRYAALDLSAYDALAPGDPAFTYALRYSRRNINPNQTKEYLDPWICRGTVAVPWTYYDYAADYMLHAVYRVTPIPGMSGGGTYDAKGNLIGIISSGAQLDGYSVPLPTVLEEYEKAQKIIEEKEKESNEN